MKGLIEKIIENAFVEDMNNGDITTDNLIDDKDTSLGEITAKEDGIVAGLEICEAVFKYLDKDIYFETLVSDGDKVSKDEVIARVKGSTRDILSSERIALNLLQRMSGIATETSRYVERIKDYKARVVDTRKTTPGIRILEKYAVKVGGGHNHRYNLSAGVMIKDNHIVAAGGIGKAIEIIKEKIPHTVKVEIEVESIDGLKEAIDFGADIVMLDNMSIEDMAKAVNLNNGRVILEASGNITLDRIESVAKTGVDVISVGALTHSVKALDISLNIV